MQSRKKIVIISISVVVAAVSFFFLFRWYKSHDAIKYSIAASTVIAISGNDYQTTLNKLHNLPIILALENDPAVTVLQSNDFLNLELAHSPGFKNIIKNRRHILSFKAGTKNQLQSLLAVEGNKQIFDSLIQEFEGDEYVISKYSSPGGEILEAYNSKKQKELVLSYAYGVIVITNEALFAEDALKSMGDLTST